MGEVPQGHTGWTFLTNHARVLAAISRDQEAVFATSPHGADFTERAVQKIISDLEQDGYLTHTRQGRSNVYHIEPGAILRHQAGGRVERRGLADPPRPARGTARRQARARAPLAGVRPSRSARDGLTSAAGKARTAGQPACRRGLLEPDIDAVTDPRCVT